MTNSIKNIIIGLRLSVRDESFERDRGKKMSKRKINLFIVLLSLFAVSAYAGIIYNGNEYTEKDMPFSHDGSGMQYFVVSGSIDNVNSWNMRSLTINGTSYTNTWSSSMPVAVDGNKYFIIYNPKNKFAHFEINGTNDWGTGLTTIDTIDIQLPYEHNGADEVCFYTTAIINNVNSYGLDNMTINGTDYTNISSETMPDRMNGGYYIYYNATQSWAHLGVDGRNVEKPDTTNITLPYSYNGIGNHYFVTTNLISLINSSGLDSLFINNVDYTNVWSTNIPNRIDGKYYIHYVSNSAYAHLELEGDSTIVSADPDTVEITLPYSFDGNGYYCFVTTYGIESISSWNASSVSVNGTDVTNQYTTTIPKSIDGKYYINYEANVENGHIDMRGTQYPDIVTYDGQDYNKVSMPFTASGSTAQYVYVYGSVDNFYSSGVSLLEINGVNYTNQSSSIMPASVDGKYLIKYIPKNRNSYFEINGTGVEPVYILNIKIFLESTLLSGAQN